MLWRNWFLYVQCRYVHHSPSLLIKPNSFPLYFRPSNIPVVPLIFKANKDVFSNYKLDEDLIEPFIVPSFFNKTNNTICLTYLSRFLWKMSTQSQVNTDRLLTCNHFSQCLYKKVYYTSSFKKEQMIKLWIVHQGCYSVYYDSFHLIPLLKVKFH